MVARRQRLALGRTVDRLSMFTCAVCAFWSGAVSTAILRHHFGPDDGDRVRRQSITWLRPVTFARAGGKLTVLNWPRRRSSSVPGTSIHGPASA
jgi:hypothetical protein